MIDRISSKLEALQNLAALLVAPETPACSLRPEVLQLGKLLTELGPQLAVDYEDISTGETRTSSGLALSPKMAAMCIDDFTRTIEFIRGTHAAIVDTLKRYPMRPARILYAGCGPYATLAVPLMSVFTSTQVQFTLIDIHPRSIASAGAVVDNLELADRVANYETTDAAAYQINPDFPPDIILLEIMQSCLDDEPQVAVTRHLLPQAGDAVLLPEEIRIDLTLVNPSAEFNLDNSGMSKQGLKRDRIPIGPVFVLNRTTVDCWKDSGNIRLNGATVQIPDYPSARYQPMLFTSISVYKNHGLRDYDSGLTCPRTLRTDSAIGSGDSIRFYYELGQQPALKAECLSGTPASS